MGLQDDFGKKIYVINFAKPGVMEDEPSKGLFGDAASFVISFTHSCFEKITYLPFPVGFIISSLEEVVEPVMHPLVETVENGTLSLLMAVDNEIYAVGTLVEGCIICTASKLGSFLSLLRKRGLIGSSADLWVTYEASLRENTQKVIDLANSIPIVNLIMPLVCAVSAPVARALCDWLVKQSQVHKKGIYLPYEDLEFHEEGQVESRAKAEDMKPEISAEGTVQEEVEPLLTKHEDDKEGIEEVEAGEREDVTVHDVADVNDVLELLDSSWVMGMVVQSPQAATTSPKSVMSPGRRTNTRSSRKGILSYE